MKKALTLTAFLVAMGGVATASTLSITTTEIPFSGTNGALLDSTYSVTAGWYNTALGFADYASVKANFVAVGSVAFPYAGNVAYNGFASGTTDFFNASTLGIEGKNVFWLISNNSTGWSLMESNSIQYGAETAIPNTNASELVSANYATWNFRVGAATPAGVTLAPIVPEPSAVLLGALGALGLLRRRRN